MTAVHTSRDLLTVDQYLALPEDADGVRAELVEGVVQVTPSPTAWHNEFGRALANALDAQIRPEQYAITDVDVDLRLAPPDEPGTVRRPDILIVPAAVYRRVVRPGGGILNAGDVLVAIELVSPGSGRRDRIAKFADYRDAGIPHYWIIDIQRGSTAETFTLTAGRGYVSDGPAGSTLEIDNPFAVRIDLGTLV